MNRWSCTSIRTWLPVWLILVGASATVTVTFCFSALGVFPNPDDFRERMLWVDRMVSTWMPVAMLGALLVLIGTLTLVGRLIQLGYRTLLRRSFPTANHQGI